VRLLKHKGYGVKLEVDTTVAPIEEVVGLLLLLLYTLIPAAFVGSVPAGLLDDFDWGQLAALVAFTAGITLVARWVFFWGLRRYESGNLVTVRG
jgi:ABC-2 type transport system permease protein